MASKIISLKLFNTLAHWSLSVKENFQSNFALQIVARKEEGGDQAPLLKLAFYWKSVFLTSTSLSRPVAVPLWS